MECKNIEISFLLPLPTRFSRLKRRKGFVGSPRCVDSRQHVLGVLLRAQKLSLLRRGLRLFLRDDLSEHNQCLGTSRGTKSGLVSRRSTQSKNGLVKPLANNRSKISQRPHIVEQI